MKEPFASWWFLFMFYFQLENLGKIPKLTKMFQMGCNPPSKFVKTLINDKQGTKSTD